MSPREVEIIRLVADGKTYREIGVILGISHKTVDQHLMKVHQKTDCYSIATVVRWAIRNGLVEA